MKTGKNFNTILKISLVFIVCLFLLPVRLFASNAKKTIAVLPFTVNNFDVDDIDEDEVGNTVARMMTESLVKTGEFTVLDYREVLNVLEKLDFDEFPEETEQQNIIIQELKVEAVVLGWIENLELTEEEGRISDWWDGDTDIDLKRIVVVAELRANLINGYSNGILAFLEGDGREGKSGVNIDDYEIGRTEYEKTLVGYAVEEALEELTVEILENEHKIPDPVAYNNNTQNPNSQEVSDDNLLEGLVSYIDNDEIIINIGSKEGVELGKTFDIIKLIEVPDPETGEIIKVLNKTIGELIVIQVEEKSSTGKLTYETPDSLIEVKDIVREQK